MSSIHRSFVHRSRLAALAILAGALAAGEAVPAPATLYPANGGTPIEAQVVRVTLSKIYMKLGGAAGGPSADVEKNTRDYQRIEYGKCDDVNYYKWRADVDKRDWEKAFADATAASTSCKWQPLREESLLTAAQAAVNAKKYDDALAAIATLEKSYAESIHLPAAYSLRGDASLAKGDQAGAAAAYKALVDKSATWGPAALVLGTKGQAAVVRAGGKPGDAAAIVAKALASLKPDVDGYGALALQMCEDLAASGKKPDAIAAYEKFVYAPIGVAAQAAAHLGAAKLLVEDAKTAAALYPAFDHACLAAVLRGADPKTNEGGKKVARDIVAKLQELAKTDAKLKELVDREYQVYLNNL